MSLNTFDSSAWREFRTACKNLVLKGKSRFSPDFTRKGFRNVWRGDMFTIIFIKYIYFAIAIYVVKLLWNTCVPFNKSKTLRRRKLCFKQFCINEHWNERSDISAIYKAIMSPSWPFLSICFCHLPLQEADFLDNTQEFFRYKIAKSQGFRYSNFFQVKSQVIKLVFGLTQL